jgi:hypothetical protein
LKEMEADTGVLFRDLVNKMGAQPTTNGRK